MLTWVPAATFPKLDEAGSREGERDLCDNVLLVVKRLSMNISSVVQWLRAKWVLDFDAFAHLSVRNKS